MPSWGTVTVVEAVWVLGFGCAAYWAWRAHAVFVAVRGGPPVPGVPKTAQRAIADFFVLLCRLLLVKAGAGLLLGLYAALLPAPPAPPPAWAASAGNAPGVVLLCVIAAAMVWTAFATFRVYRAIVSAVDTETLPDELAVVPRRKGGRRNYDVKEDESA